ncbi:purine catabolism regulator [Rhodococcus sp. 27YEA15]|uniref:PucR family transcriptional regulator n=1 Tax=Rhodococcus sp. 27YEA15 TaxID=3156259 RepID=UPI003C7B9CCB
MQPTIAEILALPIVQAGRPEVVGGGTLDKSVRWVHVSDLEDLSDLLSGGELVLTTGLPLADNPLRYLNGIAEAGAVGIIVELHNHVKSLPRRIGREADRLQLPLVALHRKIRFVELTEEVHRSIVAEQYSEVTFARSIHEIFTSLSMHRATLAEIIEAAADMLNTPLALEDLNRQVLAFAPKGHPAVTLLADWERRSRLTPVTQTTTVGGPQSWLTTPVGPPRQEWGRLVAPVQVESAERAQMTLERAAQALALHQMIEQNRSALEQQAQSGLLNELRRGRLSNESDAIARAKALGLNPGLSYLPITIRIEESSGTDHALAQRQVLVFDAIRHAVRTARQTALVATPHTDRFDLLLPQPTTMSDSAVLHAVSSEIRSALARIDGIRGCAVGVGPESTRIVEAARGLDEAAHIAGVALAMPPSGRIFHRNRDIRLRGLLALIRTDPRVQAFAEAELHGLLEHRARSNDGAYELLRNFLELGGNKTELAKSLNISRPTLYTRLAMIERLLGLSLDDPESRTSLHTAVLIADSASKSTTRV